MIDPLSAASGATRVALQVITGRKRPVLEVYANLRHRIKPEEVYKSKPLYSSQEMEHRFRSQDIFIEFILTNIGSIRAESIRLSFKGDFRKNFPPASPAAIALFSGKEIPQLAPAQSFPLFLLDQEDLLQYPAEGGKPTGMKQEGFAIVAEYTAPASGINRAAHAIARLRKRRQFTMKFKFEPALYDGLDLPAAEYL